MYFSALKYSIVYIQMEGVHGLMQSLDLKHLLARHNFWKAICGQYRKMNNN